MQIRVLADGVAVTPELAQEAERDLRRAVGAFARRVSGIAVRFFDLNGPRGGVDKACEVTVSLTRAGTIRYQAVARSVSTAIRQAVAGTREAVARRVALRRDLRRRRVGRRGGRLAGHLA